MLSLTPDPTQPPEDKPRASWEPTEILRQIELTRSRDLGPGGADGNIFFSAVALVQNRRGLADILARGPYSRPALVPASPWMAGDIPAPEVPASITVTSAVADIALEIASKGQRPYAWVVWTRRDTRWRMHAPRLGGDLGSFRVADAADSDAIAVAAMDRFGRLSPPAIIVREP